MIQRNFSRVAPLNLISIMAREEITGKERSSAVTLKIQAKYRSFDQITPHTQILRTIVYIIFLLIRPRNKSRKTLTPLINIPKSASKSLVSVISRRF